MIPKNCLKKPSALLKKARFAPIALCLGLFAAGCSLPEDFNPLAPSDSTGNDGGGGGGSSQSYLGYGYDVVKSSYINRGDVKMSNPILDQKKLTRDEMLASEPMTQQDFQLSVGTSVKKFYSDRNAGMGIDIGGNDGLGAALFSGKFGFEFNVTLNENRIDSNSYLRGHSYRYTRDEYITGMSAQILQEYLTSGFINDLGTRTAEQFLDKYGTHVLVRYYKGGALEFNYAYHGKSLTTDAQMKAALSASFSVIKGDASVGGNANSSELERNSTFHYYTRGGKVIDAFKIEELRSNYGDWLNSIEKNSDICGIGDFDNSFIPVWELAEAAGLASKAKELEDEFAVRAIAAGKALLVKKIRTRSENYKGFESYEYIGGGNYSTTYTFNEVPAEIEVYALGGGGGGQGGAKKSGILDNFTATGGSGGGGAAAYMKLTVDKPVYFNITVGGGGDGGSYNSVGLGGSGESGDPGAKGGNTSVTWSSESITLTAGGGMGGGGVVTTYVDGGSGGSFTLPNAPTTILPAKDGAYGLQGEPGDLRSSVGTQGGSAGIVYAGSLSTFGGGLGAVRQGGGNRRVADMGGGGCGGYGTDYSAGHGLAGGSGEVRIIVKYYAEE